MKQRIFTLLMMLALVIVTGSAWAADSNVNPLIDGTTVYTYTWQNVTTKNIPANTKGTVSYAVTLGSATNPTTSVQNPGTVYTVNTAMVWANDGDNAVLKLVWNPAASANPSYALWLIVTTDASLGGCSNYRRVTITPQIDFELISYGLKRSDIDPTVPAQLGASVANALVTCQDLAVRDDADLAYEGGTSDGNVYWVFEAKQVVDFLVNWDATLATTTVGATVEMWDGGTSAWVAYSALTNIPTGESRYYRLKIPAVIVSADGALAVNATLTAQDRSTPVRTDTNNTNDGKTGTVNPIPSIGAFN